jgi:ubiquitin carboxyl-terminal hydrolase 22/27/51
MNDLTLAGCLRRYVRPERLGAAAHWRCSACGSSTAALKQLSFRRLPLVLCFHVKRFEHGGAAQRPRKLDVPLSFPLHGLDMAPFTTSHMLRGVAHAPHCKPAPAANGNGSGSRASPAPSAAGEGEACADDTPSFAESCLYELFGVVSHMGDMSSGHYVSYIKCDGSWYLINDPWVVAVSEADVAQVQAYMLFYAQEQLFGTGSTGELAEQQRKQRADAAAAVVAAAAAATAKAGAGVKCEGGVKGEDVAVKREAGGGQAEGNQAAAGASAVQGATAVPGGAAVKQEPGQ